MKIDKIFNQIRNRHLSTQKFRENADNLSNFLAKKTFLKISKQKISNVVLIMILRASVAMLPAFLKFFPASPIGFVGLMRDEKTAVPTKYYQNLPRLNKNSIVIVPDPMIATGGSMNLVIKILKNKGVLAQNIYFTGLIGATVGVNLISKIIPKENITLLAIDSKLDNKYYIVPGLGDFGNRYFGFINN
jgi:uracil phosphoribosyltransferase